MYATFYLRDKHCLVIRDTLDITVVEEVSFLKHYGLPDFVDKIDLSELNYIDTSGVALFFQWKKIAAKDKRDLQFLSFPKQLKKLIDLYNLDFLVESSE